MCLLFAGAAMVKPDKARRVEEMLIHAAKSGALPGKVTEDHFIQMLGQVRRWFPFPKVYKVPCSHTFSLLLASRKNCVEGRFVGLRY